jgi:hypothetical protein
LANFNKKLAKLVEFTLGEKKFQKNSKVLLKNIEISSENKSMSNTLVTLTLLLSNLEIFKALVIKNTVFFF